MVQGPEFDWQKPASLVISTPRFLAAQRSAVSSRREEVAFTLARNTQGSADPCAIPEVLVKQCLPCRALLRFLSALSFWIAAAIWFAAYSTINLPSSKSGSPYRRKAFLLCKNPCGGDCGGDGVPAAVGKQSLRKEISRGNLLCAESGLPNLSYPRLPSTQKYETTPDWQHVRTGQPRGV